MTILDQAKDYIPDWSVEQIFIYVSWFLILLFASVGTAILLYWWYTRKKFNIKIVIFEEVYGVPQITKRDTASIITIKSTGDKVLLLNKLKHLGLNGYLEMPYYKMGIDTYAYFIRESDGELVNFKFKNINTVLNEMDVEVVSSGLKYGRAALQKLLKDSFKKSSWLKEMLPYVGFGFLIFMMSLSVWLLSGKIIEILNLVGTLLETSNNLQSTQQQILGALENVCSTSGLRSSLG